MKIQKLTEKEEIKRKELIVKLWTLELWDLRELAHIFRISQKKICTDILKIPVITIKQNNNH